MAVFSIPGRPIANKVYLYQFMLHIRLYPASMPRGSCKFIQQISSVVAKDYVGFGADLFWGLESRSLLPLTVCVLMPLIILVLGTQRVPLLYILRCQHLLTLGQRSRGKSYAKSGVSLWLYVIPQCAGTGTL